MDELYVLGCYTAMLYTGVYFWIQEAQSVAQPVEAQETRAPLISQLLALIKCTNSKVKLSHKVVFIQCYACCCSSGVPNENFSVFTPPKNMAHLAHIQLYGFEKENIYVY